MPRRLNPREIRTDRRHPPADDSEAKAKRVRVYAAQADKGEDLEYEKMTDHEIMRQAFVDQGFRKVAEDQPELILAACRGAKEIQRVREEKAGKPRTDAV